MAKDEDAAERLARRKEHNGEKLEERDMETWMVFMAAGLASGVWGVPDAAKRADAAVEELKRRFT